MTFSADNSKKFSLQPALSYVLVSGRGVGRGTQKERCVGHVGVLKTAKRRDDG